MAKSKRQKKKQQKKQLVQIFGQGSFSELQAKKAQAEAEAKKAYAALPKNEKAKIKRRERIQKKINYLLRSGIKKDEAQRIGRKDKSWDFIKQYAENQIFTSEIFLGVAWWAADGETDIMIAVNQARRLSRQELINKITQWYNEANPDTSDGFGGVYILTRNPDRQECLDEMKSYKTRGYSQTILSVSNTFTVDGVLEVMYAVMGSMSGDLQISFYKDMRYFFKTYVPELYDIIF